MDRLCDVERLPAAFGSEQDNRLRLQLLRIYLSRSSSAVASRTFNPALYGPVGNPGLKGNRTVCPFGFQVWSDDAIARECQLVCLRRKCRDLSHDVRVRQIMREELRQII